MEASSSSTSRNRMSYDVFISFRGEDTRSTFVGFLYEALRELGIMTFMDDKKLLVGDELNQTLLKAIRESRSSIVVLSKDYASSKWCLKELAMIIDCMSGTTKHRVLPVFYHVDPSDVRHQSGSFKKSFDEYQVVPQNFTHEEKEKYLKEVQNWRDSMTAVGNLSGLVVTKHSPEIDMVKKIRNQIFDTWRPKLVASDKNLVGMTSSLFPMNVHLGLGLDDIRFVGLTGMGGVGKTTIAKVVYDCISPKFECSCFLRIGSKRSKIVSLQDQMLSRLVLKEDIRIWDEDYGEEMIKKQLGGRNVLLVLDGIEEKRQLQKLAGSPEWFGPGSRVIITTRNRGMLHQPVKMLECNVESLDSGNALRLFRNNAFGIDYNCNAFMDLSKAIVEKVGRLPLALKVIGSYLNNKDEVIWKETLNRLIKIDEKELFDILKISFDGLGAESQKVFLDLACFFQGRREDVVTKLLESFGYSPHSELQLLMERCLIEASNKKISMHDSIVAMGQEIVRKESLTQPGRQSRIWLKEDVDRVFTVKHGLKYTQGIVLNLEEKQEELQLDAKSFASMTCLRILEISNVQLSGNIKYLSNLLGLLNWPGFPSKCLPSNFQSRYLLELHLPHSSIKLLWEGRKKFGRLEVIDVSDSEHLLETPNFSETPNLERLVLCNCRNLHQIHPSINSLNHLVFLNLKGCSSLKSFSSNLRCKNLEILTLSESGLTSFPEIEGNMERLTLLHLDGTLIKELHSSIGCLVGLVLLDLKNCVMLSSLPSEIGKLRSLKALILNGCLNLDQIPLSLGNTESLEYLDIGKTSIIHTTLAIHCLKKLKTLKCEGLSHNIWHSLLPLTTDSEIFDSNLSSYSFGLGSLQQLDLNDCNLQDKDIPKDLHFFSSLVSLDLSRNSFVELSPSIYHLSKLKQLNLNDCFKLQKIPRPPAHLFVMNSTTGTSVKNENCKNIEQGLFYKDSFKFDPKACKDKILEGSMFVYANFAPEILECLDEINEGDWVEVQYDQESFVKNDIYGAVLFACVECSQNDDEVYSLYGNFFIQWEITDMRPNFGVEFTSKLTPGTSNTMIYLPFRMVPKMLSTQNSFNCFKAKVFSLTASVKVQSCAAIVLSRQNAPEFLANLCNKICSSQVELYMVVTGCNNRSECSSYIDPENTIEEDFCSSTSVIQSAENESNSFSLLKTNLKSILRRTYEEGKRDYRVYFFPQGGVSVLGWFRIQQMADTVAMKLPVNLFKEKKWMGLAGFAVFSLQGSSEFVHTYSFGLHLGYADSRCVVQGDSYPFAHCQIPMAVFKFSARVLVLIFQPPHKFPNRLNKWDHLYINFFTNPARLRVELCGARLVYQQNVEGFIHTIMDCVLKSGEEFYKDYIHKIMGDLLKTYHRRIRNVPQSLKVVVPEDPPTASRCSDQGLLPVQKLLESFPHPLFMMSIQDRYKSKFNVILHGNKIPEIFTCQRRGNEATIEVPQRFRLPIDYGESFLVCALVKVDRIREPQTCLEVLDLICEFGVDSYQIEPRHHHSVAEEKLLREYQTQFLWVFHVPIAAFDIFWSCCNFLKCKISTNNEQVFSVQECGLRIVPKKERTMVDNFLISLLPHQPMP